MIEDAEQRGALNPGDTGIGLAMVAAVKGYKAVFVMSANMSEERKIILRAFGAQLVLTPAEKGTVGAIEEAQRLAKEKGYFFVGQHFNPANTASHESTADEIWEDLGDSLCAVICSTGTGGSIPGIGKFLKQRNAAVEMIATEPADSPILSKGIACPHKIMGTAPGFIPEILDTAIYDQIIPSAPKRRTTPRDFWQKKRGCSSASHRVPRLQAC